MGPCRLPPGWKEMHSASAVDRECVGVYIRIYVL
jgi:hypothetical protein